MITRPLHLFGTWAEAVAPFIARLGVPVTTAPPTSPDAPQLHCHRSTGANAIVDGANLWRGRTRAPEGILGSWDVAADNDEAEYAAEIGEAIPSTPIGVGAKGLLELLERMGYAPTLSLDAIIPPHLPPDAAPDVPPSWIRHTATLPRSMTEFTPGAHISQDVALARDTFWQLSPELRDAWLVHPHCLTLMQHMDRVQPIDVMIWHRGSATTEAVRARFEAVRDAEIRKAYLHGLIHWGAPEEIAARPDLHAAAAVRLRGNLARIEYLERSIDDVGDEVPMVRARAECAGDLAMLRLLERDPTFRTALLEGIDARHAHEQLLHAADAMLPLLESRLESGAPHPTQCLLGAYLDRAMPRRKRTREEVAMYMCSHGKQGEPILRDSDTPREGLARLSELALDNRGGLWREIDRAGHLEVIVGAWGRQATTADDLAVADWLQSFRGPVNLLARVANGVLTWPTLSPATATGIAMARARSARVGRAPQPETLIRRIPTEQIPAEWLAIAATHGRANAPVRRKR